MSFSRSTYFVWVSLFFTGTISFCTTSFGYSVRPGHPRIYITEESVDDLRYRCLNVSPIREEYESVKSWVDSRTEPHENKYVFPSELPVILIVYMVEERDRTYLDKAKIWLSRLQEEGPFAEEWSSGFRLKALSLGYDWLYPDLTEEERTGYAHAIEDMADLLKSLPRDVPWANQYSDYSNQYYWFFSYIAFAGIALCGESGFAEKATEYLDYAEVQLKQHMLPATNQVAGRNGGWHEGLGAYTNMTAYPLADVVEGWRTATGEDLFLESTFLRHLPQFLFYCRRPHDGNYTEIADIRLPATWSANNVDAEGAYMPLLENRYQNSFAKDICDHILPHQSHKMNNWAYLLWYDPEVADLDVDTISLAMHFDGVGYAVMRTGWDSPATFAILKAGDFYAGHQHDDQGSFLIHRKGTLLTEGGEYGFDDASYHNTMLIGGGQIHYRNNQVQFYQEMDDTRYDFGDITAFESTKDYDYAACDITNAYESAKVVYFQREFVFLKPECFVIFDRVKSTDDSYTKKFVLNCLNPPVLNETSVTISDGDAMLLCRTILPENVSIHYLLNDDGRYRIEIEPSVPGLDDQFLHILYLCDAGGSELPSIHLIDAGNMKGTYVEGDRFLLFGSAPGILDSVEYSFAGSDTVTHLLFNMQPGREYKIFRDDARIMVTHDYTDWSLVKIARSTASGVLSFNLVSSPVMRGDIDNAIREHKEGWGTHEEVEWLIGKYYR